MQAVIYCRISSEDQSNNSLPHQEISCREYCQRNGLTVVKNFTENGKSAFTFDRPEWKKLESFIKENKRVSHLVVYHIDRFSRANLLEALIKLNEIENKLGVKVLAVTDPVGQNNKDLGVQLMRTINLLFSNNERNRIQERTKDGMYRSLASGRYTGMAPYGYLNGKDSNGKPLLIPEPHKAEIVKKIFKLFNDGVGMFEIKRKLPEFTQRNRSAIRDILSRSIYAGIIQVPPYKGKPGYETPAIHKAIITKSQYYAAQMKLQGRTNTHQPTEQVYLRGWLLCPECGRKMTAGRSKGHSKYYWYYKCDTHRDNFSAVKVHAVLDTLLDNLALPETSQQFIREQLQASINKYNKDKGGNVMRLKLQLSKVQEKIKTTQSRYLLNPDIDIQVYSKIMNELKAEESATEEKLLSATKNTHELTGKLDTFLNKLSRLKEAFHSFPLIQKQLFLKVVLSGEGSYNGQIWTTAGLHPLFADKALKLKELNLLQIINAPGEGAIIQGCIHLQTYGQLIEELSVALAC